MTFTVRGRLGEARVEVSWSDELEERLGGDLVAIGRVEELETSGVDVFATPTGPHFTAGRDPAHVALTTIIAALDSVDEVAGDVPEMPEAEIPKDATA